MTKKNQRLPIILSGIFVFITISAFYSVWTLEGKERLSFKLWEVAAYILPRWREAKQAPLVSGAMSEQTLRYFRARGRIERRDAAEVRWCHAVNSRSKLTEALSGSPPQPPTLTLNPNL